MVMYHYVERIREFSLPPIFLYNIYDREKYYTDEPVNIHIKYLTNIIQYKNWLITTKMIRINCQYYVVMDNG